MISRGSLNTEAANNQQQISTHEFITSHGSSRTHYLIVTCCFIKKTLDNVYFIEG